MPSGSRAQFEQERIQFRAQLGAERDRQWAGFAGRIAVVLSGGGARGSYEAGVLLALQDARLPSHILASTSIGSINAASYAGHSNSLVGNAEPLVESWLEVTPPAVGIDWSRYLLLLAGLIAASAGFGNLVREWLRGRELYLHLHHPKLTWLVLGLLGVSLLLFYDRLTYMVSAVVNALRRQGWKPNPRAVMVSMLANLMVGSLVLTLILLLHLHAASNHLLALDAPVLILSGMGVALFLVLWWFLRDRLSLLGHQVLRFAFRSGLFANYERERFLRRRIPTEALRASPIRVVMTAADVRTGRETYFTNATREALLSDPGVDRAFVTSETEPAEDLMKAVIASSAFPLVYEPVEMHGQIWTDGGIVANQPIRPAIRLGADVLFLVLLEPCVPQDTAGKAMTFLDMGVRALEILMAQNLRTDLKVLENINRVCELHAARMGTRPEQVSINLGTRTYRYVKAFRVCPGEPLPAAVLDFDGAITGPAIQTGYRDGGRAILAFREYLSHLPPAGPRRVLRLNLEELPEIRA